MSRAIDVPTAADARAIRPRADDPTTLENGSIHPRYGDWLLSRTWQESHPLLAILMEHSESVTGVDGYFDRARVKRELGTNGPGYWKPDGPLPSKARVPALATLLGLDSETVASIVAQEKKARHDYQGVIARCCWLPYKLLTYEQMAAGVPCPACGRPWLGTVDQVAEDSFRREHADCHAGSHSVAGGPSHCMRCCGFPPVSPEVTARVEAILASFSPRGSKDAQPPPSPSRAERREQRIAKLEAELEILRAQQAEDENK